MVGNGDESGGWRENGMVRGENKIIIIIIIKRNERKENEKESKEGCLDGEKGRENEGRKEAGLRVFFVFVFLSFSPL